MTILDDIEIKVLERGCHLKISNTEPMKVVSSPLRKRRDPLRR